MDRDSTLELLGSLAEYAEAGAAQPQLVNQAVDHALEVHGEDPEVLTAVARLLTAAGRRAEIDRLLGERAAWSGPQVWRRGTSEAERESDPPVAAEQRRSPAPVSGTRELDGPSSRRGARDPVPSSANQTMRSMRQAAQGLRDASPGGADRRPEQRPTARMPRVTDAEVAAAASQSAPPSVRRWGSHAQPSSPRPPESEAAPASTRSGLASGETAPSSQRSGWSDGSRGGSEVSSSRLNARTPTSKPSAEGAREEIPSGQRSARQPVSLKFLDPKDARRRLDRYDLIGEIASGGMATVYLARLAGAGGFQRFYAIKRLHPHLADEQEFTDMFLDEARLAAGIHHPNVVPILEVGSTSGGYYLVMDYVEGDTLAGVFTRSSMSGGIPKPVALRIVLDALHGLDAAHEMTDADGAPIHLVHRDCSPQNILVGVDGTSRITDFGVARAAARISTTRSSTVKGKIAYLSPEQATGQALNRRSDLFGMGVILWEVLAGRRLFRADTEGATLSRILVEPIPHLSHAAPHLPPGVCLVTATALARDPEDRFASAAEMAEALEQSVREADDPGLFIASPREVATYMRDLLGVEVQARRDLVRAWIAAAGDDAAPSGPRSDGRRQDVPAPQSGGAPTPKIAGRAQDAEPQAAASPSAEAAPIAQETAHATVTTTLRAPSPIQRPKRGKQIERAVMIAAILLILAAIVHRFVLQR